MPVVARNKKTVKSGKVFKKKATRFVDMPDLSKDPYILKKNEKAKEMLRQSGLLKD
jgi:hypothetical protein